MIEYLKNSISKAKLFYTLGVNINNGVEHYILLVIKYENAELSVVSRDNFKDINASTVKA